MFLNSLSFSINLRAYLVHPRHGHQLLKGEHVLGLHLRLSMEAGLPIQRLVQIQHFHGRHLGKLRHQKVRREPAAEDRKRFDFPDFRCSEIIWRIFTFRMLSRKQSTKQSKSKHTAVLVNVIIFSYIFQAGDTEQN